MHLVDKRYVNDAEEISKGVWDYVVYSPTIRTGKGVLDVFPT